MCTFIQCRSTCLAWSFFIVLCIPMITFSQITITFDDWNNSRSVGTTLKGYTSNSGSMQLQIGLSSATSQTWDFRQITFTHLTDEILVDPNTAPHISYASDANVVREATQNGITEKYYQYNKLTDNEYLLLATGMENTAEPKVYTPPVPQVRFPCSFGDTWSYDGDPYSPVTDVTITEHLVWTVDAFGTLKLPQGDYDVLRVKTVSTIEMTSPAMSYVRRSISFNFGSKGIAGAWVSVDTNSAGSDMMQVNGIGYEIPGTPSDVENIHASALSLEQNYPNPFTGQTNIRYTLLSNSHVDLKVFDVFGRAVTTLIDEERDAGEHTAIFDMQNSGLNLVPGIYFYRLYTNDYSITKKMILCKK